MAPGAIAWVPDHRTADLESTAIGRVTVIVWTGTTDPNGDNGRMVCSAYIPTTDREFAPDGRMIVGRYVLDTTDREVARSLAIALADESARANGFAALLGGHCDKARLFGHHVSAPLDDQCIGCGKKGIRANGTEAA